MEDYKSLLVRYEIEKDGNCEKCKSMQGCNDGFMCFPFRTIIRRDWTTSTNELKQCQECKDFLKEEPYKMGLYPTFTKNPH